MSATASSSERWFSVICAIVWAVTFFSTAAMTERIKAAPLNTEVAKTLVGGANQRCVGNVECQVTQCTVNEAGNSCSQCKAKMGLTSYNTCITSQNPNDDCTATFPGTPNYCGSIYVGLPTSAGSCIGKCTENIGLNCGHSAGSPGVPDAVLGPPCTP